MTQKYSLEVPMAVFDLEGYAVQAGWAVTYTARPNREYYQAWQEYIAIGTTLPAMAYVDAPTLPTEDNKAIRRTEDGKAWETVDDYRGQVDYSTDTGEPRTIDYLGPIITGWTLLAPQTPYDKWDGSKWVTDKAAQHVAEVAAAEAQKSQLITEADNVIAPLERAVKRDMATDEEKARLDAWEHYSVLLSRVDTDKAPDIEWPDKPE